MKPAIIVVDMLKDNLKKNTKILNMIKYRVNAGIMVCVFKKDKALMDYVKNY